MKKSPLSRVNANRCHKQSPYAHKHHQNFGRIDHDGLKSGIAYQGHNIQDYCQVSTGCDFIPFETSSPLSQRSNSGSWQGSGGSYSSSYKNKRGSFYNSPVSNQSSPYSCSSNTPKHHYKRQNFRNCSKKILDITAYLDFDSMFEDPWAELEEKLNNKNGSKLFEDDSLGNAKLENDSLSPDENISDKLSDKTVELSDLSQDNKP